MAKNAFRLKVLQIKTHKTKNPTRVKAKLAKL